MENTNIVTAEQQAPNTISASNAIFNVQALGQLTAFANLMADSQVTVPAHLAGKPADCMAIVMQAMQWGMNPYAVAQKTHLVLPISRPESDRPLCQRLSGAAPSVLPEQPCQD